jgi:hypothetical protein
MHLAKSERLSWGEIAALISALCAVANVLLQLTK